MISAKKALIAVPRDVVRGDGRVRQSRLGLALAAIFVGQFLVFAAIVSIYRGPSFFTAFSVGFDYQYYYKAAELWIHGQNPYPQISALPMSIVSGLLFVNLPLDVAFRCYQALNFVLVVGSVALFCRKIGMSRSNTACMLLLSATYGPLFYLVRGGNADGIMLALLVAACSVGNTAVRGVLLALSVWTKLYSMLAIAVLAVRRRWRLVGIAVVLIVLLAIPLRSVLDGANTAVHVRAGWFRTTGNISPAVLWAMVAGVKRVAVWRSLYLMFWGGTLLAMLAGRRDRDIAETIVDCTPWMVAAPALVYVYSGVLLLPMGARLVRTAQQRRLRIWEWLSVAGFTLVGFYPAAFVSVLPLTAKAYSNGNAVSAPIAAFGVTLLLIGTAGDGLKGNHSNS